ncbi:hypothetical protein BU15DRAFT_80114 [Melanogaster broomeanus]|nr:hypothetical protein BU15DRAFT_80114 [Melanogaster broomeanus]
MGAPSALITDVVKRSSVAHIFYFYPILCEIGSISRKAPSAWVLTSVPASPRPQGDDPPHSRPHIGAPDTDGRVIEVDARALTKECLRVLGKEMGAVTKSSKNAQSLSSIHEDEVEASESDQPYNPKHDRMKSLPSKEGHTPIGRKKKGSSNSSKQKTQAREANPNHSLCLLTRRGEPVVETCHLVAGSTKPHTLTQLEYAWGLRHSSLNLDSRFNVFFLRSDWHTLFDRGLWLLVPQLEDLETLRNRTTSNKNAKGRRKVNIDGGWGEETTFQYHVLCTPDLKEPIHPFDGPEKDAGYTVHGLPFPNLGPLISHVRPHFVVANSAPKLTRLALAQLLDMIIYLYAEWMQLDTPIGFTGFGDGNKPDNASRPPSERAPSADGEGDEPDDGSNSTGTESESGDNAEVSTPSKKPSHGRRNAMDIQSQSSDTEESVMDDDEWGSSEETAWIEEICDWAEKCREATSSEGGWEPDAVNDEQMAAYAKEPSRPAPPPEKARTTKAVAQEPATCTSQPRDPRQQTQQQAKHPLTPRTQTGRIAQAARKPQDAPHGIAGDNANPEVWEVDERTRMAQGIDEEDQVETPIDETTNTHANGTRAGQRHNANAHGEGRCAWAEWHTGHTTSDLAQVPDGIIEDPGGRTEPSDGTAASAPSGGRPARVSSGRRRRRIPTCAVHRKYTQDAGGPGSTLGPPGPEPEDSEPAHATRVCLGLRYNSLNLDSRFNTFFLRSDWHTLFDRGLWLLIPQLEDLETLRNRTTKKNLKDRHNVNIDRAWGEETMFEYHVLCMLDLKEPIHRFDGPEKDAGYTVHSLPFPNLGPLTSHVRPHFVVANTAPKLGRAGTNFAQFAQLVETLVQVSLETRESALKKFGLITQLYSEWAQLGIPTGFTGSGDGNRPDDASQPPSERAPSADGEGDVPDIQSQSSDTQDSVVYDDEWGSSEEAAWIEEIRDWAERCREATSSEGGWEPDAFNDDKMAAYAKEPSRPAPPPESWHKWRPRWEPRIGNQPQFFNTAMFSSNDWAIYEGHAPLTGSAR